jgi:hypothetical protein
VVVLVGALSPPPVPLLPRYLLLYIILLFPGVKSNNRLASLGESINKGGKKAIALQSHEGR